MSRIFVINPNTTASVTALLQRHGQALAGQGVEIEAATAWFGAPYISCEASYAIAGHAVLDAWARAAVQREFDAVLIGCFGDPGLFALREVSGIPVVGLAEAAFAAGAKRGRFAVVTGGERWKPMLERLAGSLGVGTALAGIRTVAPTGAQLAQDPAAARKLLAAACEQAALDFKADAVILGGAGLAGMAAQIQVEVNVPLIDSVSAGFERAIELAAKRPPVAPGRLQELQVMLSGH